MIFSDNDARARAISDQALDWLVRMRENPDEPGLRGAFESWILESPEHRREWEKTCHLWKAMGQASDFYPRKPARRRVRKRLIVGGAVAAGLAICLLVFVAPSFLIRLQADYWTETAQTLTVTLADGTTVLLAPDSAIAIGFAGRERRVTLLSGEAFFNVMHDEAHPFRVAAGDVTVEVLGTAFDVSIAEDNIAIGLARGSVKATGTVAGAPVDRTLVPGEIIMVDHSTGGVREEKADVADIGAWREGRLYVTNATIGSVVEQLQRYHSAWISIPDASLARQRVTGIYDLNAPDQALGALVDPYGGKVRKVSNLFRVVSRF
ncbi:FecR family protein [Neorhizobium galegae]|uniref:FecR family protein n=1 Tax=Neorhizobium galegae TaxID=399 RepID=UPI0027D874E6|nr:FecR family protein [Neorhizobium galegae]